MRDSPARLLFWLSGALGDTLLAFPALSALRNRYPDALLTAVGRLTYFAIAREMGLVDQVLDSDSSTVQALFSGRLPSGFSIPDCAVVFSASHRDRADRLRVVGFPMVLGASAHSSQRQHQSSYLLSCLQTLTVEQEQLYPRWLLGNESASSTAQYSISPPTVLLHPGAGASWKQWPLRQYLSLASLLRAAGLQVLWSFGQDDAALRTALALLDSAAAAEALPDLPLQGLARILAHCSLLVSADTGIAHLAALLGVPQVTLFGPTDPVRWRPLNDRAMVVEAANRHDCRWLDTELSVTSDGGRGVPLRRCVAPLSSTCVCMAELSADRVWAALSAAALLNRELWGGIHQCGDSVGTS